MEEPEQGTENRVQRAALGALLFSTSGSELGSGQISQVTLLITIPTLSAIPLPLSRTELEQSVYVFVF